MTVYRTRTLLAAIAAFGLIAAACGDDATETTAAVTATTSTAAALTTTTAAAATTTTSTTTTTTTTTAAPTPLLALAVDGWPRLEGGALYEAWLVVDDTPTSAGVFNVADGAIIIDDAPADGLAIGEDLVAASAVVITIEPAGDGDPGPSDTHFLAGDLTDGAAELSIAHPAALGTDFADADGEYVLATPTDGDRVNNEFSGVWFLTFPGPTPGLTLPELPPGWIYEGWTVIEGIPVTSGTFLAVDQSDNEAPYSGTVRTPNFPGEDYLFNAPAGLTFPTDLSGSTVVVSVEPLTENNPAPFALKPLAGPVPVDAELEPVAYPITNEGFAPPTGTATLTTTPGT